MSETITSLLEAKDFSAEIGCFVMSELGGSDNIEKVEENCGSMWIETKNGKTYSVIISECETDEFKHMSEQFDTPKQN